MAISGGVDSSVAVVLLKRAGFNVVGIFMKLVDSPRFKEGEKRAKKVAKILKIPFLVLDLRKEFKKRIINYFLDGYKKGITPNPCVVCNKEIKFGLLREKALALDAGYIATGHYARTNPDWKNLTKNPPGQNVKWKLLRGKDKDKDQSYFLWMLNQKQLRRVLFPIGDYTRAEVEKLAKKFTLPVLKARKSVEICFIQAAINDFLVRHLKQKPGQIVYSTPGVEYRVIGRHRGLAFYTIGQRKGIGLPGGPYYVLDKDLKKNLLIVTKNEKDYNSPTTRQGKTYSLYKKELICKNVNWISGKEPKLPLKIKAKIRYRHKTALSMLIKHKTWSMEQKKYKVIFDKLQRAITPGQSVVFYSGKELIGGGVIC